MGIVHRVRCWLYGQTDEPLSKSADKLEFYEATPGQWRWRLVAANNRIVAASSEAFSSKAAAQLNLRRTRKGLNSDLSTVSTPLSDSK